MPRQTFKQEFLISLCCSLAVVVVLACNSTNTTYSAKSLASNLALGAFSHIVPASNNAPLFASMFQTTSQTASDVPESFQFTCMFLSEQWANWTAGQIVPITPLMNAAPANICQNAFTAPQPAQVFWSTLSLNGDLPVYNIQAVFHPGTVQSLVVSAQTTSGQEVRCSDLSHTGPVADGDAVIPYVDPQTYTVTLYNGTSNLGLSCQLSGFPPTARILLLTVRFAKV